MFHTAVLHEIPPLIPFFTINNMSILVNNSNSTSVILKQAFHANSGADKT